MNFITACHHFITECHGSACSAAVAQLNVLDRRLTHSSRALHPNKPSHLQILLVVAGLRPRRAQLLLRSDELALRLGGLQRAQQQVVLGGLGGAREGWHILVSPKGMSWVGAGRHAVPPDHTMPTNRPTSPSPLGAPSGNPGRGA